MTVIINEILFHDVFRCGFCDCEVFFMFNKDHRYSSMGEIEERLKLAGLSVGNFYFKGVNAWDYSDDLFWKPEASKDGETSVLCVIPENIRDTFNIYCDCD